MMPVGVRRLFVAGARDVVAATRDVLSEAAAERLSRSSPARSS
jgi:hypothetical protein